MIDTPFAIDVKNLTKKYSNKNGTPPALSNVSFQLELGKICVLLGPNGSGKTTLLKILAGLLSPTEGSVSIMGIDIHEQPLLARKNMGWMPSEERSGFYGRLTGRENLNFFSALYGLKGESLERHIGNLRLLLGIGDDIHKQSLRVSSGFRQKLSVARTLLHDPQVLLMDEPFRNLDPHTVIRLRRLLKDHLARVQKKTILLSTHQLEEAQKIADSVLIIQKGEIVKHFSPLDLKEALKKKTVENIYLKLVSEESI